MATPSPRRTAASSSRYPPRPAVDPDAPLEVVDPRWLLKALGLAVVAATLLGYLSVCLLVFQGGWQAMLSPSPRVDLTPAAQSIPFQPIRFDSAATGRPRLSGWWLPADSPTTPTILFLHGGSGSLSATVRTLALLHSAGVAVFAFDYRGFGQSDGPHPTEARMNEDAAAALDYLVNTRHVPPQTLVPYGEGLGAVIAANLLNAHPELPVLIVDTPDPGAYDRATGNGRARLLPMRLLIREHFDVAVALARPGKPRLLLADGPFGSDPGRIAANQALFRTVPDPKMAVTFSPPAEQAYVESIRRFLDEYLSAVPPPAVPSPTNGR